MVKRQKLAELEARCQVLGLPLTIQRRAILEALASLHGHPTADEVLASLPSHLEGVSRATVYRTLEAFVSNAIVVRVCHPGSAVRYDVRVDQHHHLVCDACGKITDFDEPALDALPLPSVTRLGFRVQGFSVHVRGLCRSCARSQDSKRKMTEE